MLHHDQRMRATDWPAATGDNRLSSMRHPRSLRADEAATDRFQVILFEWRVKAGIQPVMMVTRRRLD